MSARGGGPDSARLVEELLHETEARFRNMADASPVLLWMSREDGLCTFFNQTWLDFTGRTLEEEWGVGWAEGVHFEDFQRCLDTYVAAFNARRHFEMEYRLRRADGEYRWLLDRGTPRYRPDGTFAGYIGSCADITERRQLEAELREAVRVRDEFLSIASHELRTPLTSLQLQLDSLQVTLQRRPEQALASGRIARDVDRGVRAVERLVGLVNQLLDVSRIRAGKLALDWQEDVDIAGIAEEVADRFRSMAERAGSALEVSVQGPARGTWDRARIDQVLTNLVANAVKYGGGEPVRIEVAGGEASVRVAVIDRGVGIEPASQSRLFERFERAVSTRAYGGLGLGLWISRQIVEAMEGSIQLESSLPGQGSTFAFALPCQPSGAVRDLARGTER